MDENYHTNDIHDLSDNRLKGYEKLKKKKKRDKNETYERKSSNKT